MQVLAALRAHLDSLAIPYREVHHEPTLTSEDSARARGEDLRIGGKALLIKAGNAFGIFVISASRRLDSGALKAHLGVRKTRFASAEELRELTGLVPGSVPPFGNPILPFPLYADTSVFENEKIAFNAGSLTDSIIMAAADYRRAAQPEVFTFSE